MTINRILDRAGNTGTNCTSESQTTNEVECDQRPAVSASERARLKAELEAREELVRQSRRMWQEGPTALMEIRDRRLYLAKGFSEFGTYCRKELKLGKSTVNRYVRLGEVCQILASTGATLPTTERQLRPLLALRRPGVDIASWGQDVVRVWEKVTEEASITKTRITQNKVVRAIQALGLVVNLKRSSADLVLESRWSRVKGQLNHEKEFWSGDNLAELHKRLIALTTGWIADSLQGRQHRADPRASDDSIFENNLLQKINDRLAGTR